MHAQSIDGMTFFVEDFALESEIQDVKSFKLEEIPAKVDYAEKTGDIKTLYTLGHMYNYGDPVEPDFKNAKYFYKLAADQEHLPSIMALARLYYLGSEAQNVPPNPSKARKIFERAYRLDNGEAMFELALLYQNGEGVLVNEKKAFRLMEESAETGYPNGVLQLAFYYLNGTGTTRDVQTAIDLFHHFMDIVKDDHTKIYTRSIISNIYYDIANQTENLTRRFTWYLYAAEYGNIDSMAAVAESYRDGIGVKKDYLKSRAWFEKIAAFDEDIDKYNVGFARRNLGYLFQEGLGVPQDYHKALEYYEKASQIGNGDAACDIGIIHQYGLVGIRNMTEAQKWYDRCEHLRTIQAAEAAERQRDYGTSE